MQQLQAQITKEAKDRITLIDAYLKERLPPTQEMATDFDVLFLVGVNGSGKTTTAAKLATYVREQMGRTPYLIPADTYRAGAVDQLVTWAKRVNCPYFESTLSDPGAVIFQGIDAALAHYDRPCIIIDTSGRLQTHKNLMSELIKMKKIVERKVDISRIRTILILDGSQGQNMLQQVKIFHEALNLSSLIITKLDGSSKAGVLCQLYDSYHIGV
ncbi:MAG: hypothetical protein FJ161_00745 [Gammaproteobacteria bacterium]|nr:hypothetical protein [Gammaproteobacteria bacterium]